ncbi:MAG TPA: hypothetical protein DDW67_07930 [Elusimicrobia bacterium]|jgi:hypothetical protein|nr:hypothetical protein [Elusimicrobiota bacterium]
MKKVLIGMTLLPVLFACSKGPGQPPSEGDLRSGPAAAAVLEEGEKTALPDGGYFTWKFSEKPKLGVIIINLQAFGPDGKPDTAYGLVGEFGMPSMKYHDSGPKPFILSRKGHYLLPVEFSMAGEWEIVIRVSREGKEIYEGRKLLTI